MAEVKILTADISDMKNLKNRYLNFGYKFLI